MVHICQKIRPYTLVKTFRHLNKTNTIKEIFGQPKLGLIPGNGQNNFEKYGQYQFQGTMR